MNDILKITCFITLLLGVSFMGHAQDDWEESGQSIDDAQLVIEKEAQLEMPTVTRNFGKMSVLEYDGRGTNNEYVRNLIDKRTGDINPFISPLRMPVETSLGVGPSDNYFKLGVGNFFTSYLEAMFTDGVEDSYTVGAHVKHLVSRNGPIDGRNSGSGQNGAELFGKVFTEAGTLTGSIGYDRIHTHFYGYDSLPDGMEIDRDSIYQKYETFNAKVDFLSQSDMMTDFQYQAGADFHYISDNLNASEYSLGLDFGGKYFLVENSGIELNVEAVFSQLRDTATVNRGLYKLGAAYDFDNGQFHLTAGARVAYNAEDGWEDSRFRIYPHLRLDYVLVDEVAAVYAQVSGDLEQVTLREVSQENPWLAPNLNLLHTDKQLEVLAGLSTSPSGNLGVNVEVGFARLNNLYFLANDTLAPASFRTIYDNGVTNRLHLQAESSFSAGGFRGVLKLGFFSYGTDSLEAAWHRPSMLNNFTASYAISDEFRVYTDIYHIGGLEAPPLSVEQGPTVELESIFDANIRFDYRISDNFSAFLSLNNILSQNYQRYYRYDVRGFNMLAGVAYSFDQY